MIPTGSYEEILVIVDIIHLTLPSYALASLSLFKERARCKASGVR